MSGVVAWARTRLPPTTFAPLTALLVLAAGAGDLSRWALAGVLVVLLRLADDLTDARHDADLHPERVLPRARSRAPFLGTAVLLALAALGLAAAVGGLSPVVVLTLLGVLALLPLAPRRARVLPSLGKYGLVVLALAPTPAALPPVVVVAAFVAHEVLHDPALGGRGGAAGLLLSLVTLTAAAWAAGAAACVAAAVASVWLWRRHARAHPRGLWCRGPFLVALPPLVIGASA